MDFQFRGVDFQISCENRIKRLVRTNKSQEDMTFQIYDFHKGEVIIKKITFSGGSSPTIDDPLYVSIVAELKEEENSLANAIPDGPPWQVVIPTNIGTAPKRFKITDFTPPPLISL